MRKWLIERLLGMQRYNGSFGLWGADGQEEYWLTAYVTDFLLLSVCMEGAPE